MAAKPLDPDKVADIITDWRLGQMSQRQIADKHKVSNGVVAKLTKGISKDSLPRNRESSATQAPVIVYAITAKEFNGVYKIGMTNDIERRLRDMQTGCPFLLSAFRVYEVSNPVAVESMLHAFFHKKRTHGEWFKLSVVDFTYIDEAMDNIEEVMNGLQQ